MREITVEGEIYAYKVGNTCVRIKHNATSRSVHAPIHEIMEKVYDFDGVQRAKEKRYLRVTPHYIAEWIKLKFQ